MSASARPTTAPKPAWCTPARCARNSARPPRRCSSPRAMSTKAPRRPRRASRAKSRATSIRASPTRPSRCSRQRMAAFEGAEAARATATGMAAVTLALIGQVQGGRSRRRREGAVRLLPLRGRGFSAALRRRLDAGRRHRPRRNGASAVRPNTKTFFLETPTNPTLGVIDIAEVAKIAHAAGATLVVDNVFATPLLQSPLALGADCVVYSATKHIDGQGRCLGGVILASREVHPGQRPHPDPADRARRCRRSTPGCC